MTNTAMGRASRGGLEAVSGAVGQGDKVEDMAAFYRKVGRIENIEESKIKRIASDDAKS